MVTQLKRSTLKVLLAASSYFGTVGAFPVLTKTLWFDTDPINPKFLTSKGTLSHVQTVDLQPASPRRNTQMIFSSLRSLLVATNGSEVLAVSQDGSFVTMPLSSSTSSELPIDVKTARVDLMRDVNGNEIRPRNPNGNAEGLTINGVYEGGGRGELFVNYANTGCVMKFSDGVLSRRAEDLCEQRVPQKCEENGGIKSILKLRSTEVDDLLLIACEEPEETSVESGHMTFSVSAHDMKSGEDKQFYVQSQNSYFPMDMAELPNGDILILFHRSNPADSAGIYIGLVTSESLDEAILNEGVLVPESITGNLAEIKYYVHNTSGITVREDTETGKIFVYILGNYMELHIRYWDRVLYPIQAVTIALVEAAFGGKYDNLNITAVDNRRL
ncbi:hypothetical protein FOL47_000335 [Perkinsus chesapeaki]|uniref:Uncharacterized protein n=1 Tax=Perkinsus chesapeaki TaxID=330153 RepID=A0A7J6MM49_PERCH|nr:hypothetical protein FOL47_000335 [Perkinsus chesapeaki]